jgi:Trypsin-like peptidase domain
MAFHLRWSFFGGCGIPQIVLRCAVLAAALFIAPLGAQSGPRHVQDAPLLGADAVFRRASVSVFLLEAVNRHGDVLLRQNGVAIKTNAILSTKNILESAAHLGVEHGMGADETIARYVLRQGFRTWNITNVRIDPQRELSIFECPDLGAQPVQMRNSATLSVGEKVYAVGFPKGQEETLASGVISALRGNGGDRLIDSSVSLSEESAGSGLFDARGKLIGIINYDVLRTSNSAFPAELSSSPNVPFSVTPKPGAEPPKTNDLFNSAAVWSYNFREFAEMALVKKNMAFDEVKKKIEFPSYDNSLMVRLHDSTILSLGGKDLPESIDNWPLWRQANAYMESIRFDIETGSRAGVDDDGLVSVTFRDGRKLWSDIADLYCHELPGGSFTDLEGKVRACALER